VIGLGATAMTLVPVMVQIFITLPRWSATSVVSRVAQDTRLPIFFLWMFSEQWAYPKEWHGGKIDNDNKIRIIESSISLQT